MLCDGFIAVPEKVDPQERIFVAPFADGLAAFGGDEAAAGCANCEVVVCGVGNVEAGDGKENLVEGKRPG